jgi:hypothetical protein
MYSSTDFHPRYLDFVIKIGTNGPYKRHTEWRKNLPEHGHAKRALFRIGGGGACVISRVSSVGEDRRVTVVSLASRRVASVGGNFQIYTAIVAGRRTYKFILELLYKVRVPGYIVVLVLVFPEDDSACIFRSASTCRHVDGCLSSKHPPR